MASVLEAPIFEMRAAFSRGRRGALYIYPDTVRGTRREAKAAFLGSARGDLRACYELQLDNGDVAIRKVDVTINERFQHG